MTSHAHELRRLQRIEGLFPGCQSADELEGLRKARFAGDLLDSLRALIFWRPNEGDFEFVRVPDLSYQTDLTHLFHGEQNKRENFSTTDGMGGGERLYAEIACGHSIAKREFRV